MAKKRITKKTSDVANQGADGGPIGPGNPPKAYQFKPGESGNPKGQPKHRMHLWTYLCKYMAMTEAQLEALDKRKLKAAQRTALEVVMKAMNGEDCNSVRLMQYAVDRELGRAAQKVALEGQTPLLSPEECEAIRAKARRWWERMVDRVDAGSRS